MTICQTKLVGLLGGMKWESSALNYRLLNTVAHRRLAGHHIARDIHARFRPTERSRCQR